MASNIELGIGLLLGVLLTLFIVLAIRYVKGTNTKAQALLPLLVARKLLEDLDVFAVVMDDLGEVVYMNGVAREHDSSQNIISRLTSENSLEIVFQVLSTAEAQSAALQPRVKSSGDVELVSKAETVETLSLRYLPLDDSHVAVIAVDNTLMHRVVDMRRDFIANVSHELKTPVSAIGLLAEAIVLAADDPARVRKFAGKISSETERLGELSKAVIRLSEAQAPLHQSSLERIDLRAMVHSQAATLQDFATGHGVKIVVRDESEDSADLTMPGRRAPLESAVHNLVTNAVGHSPAGGQVTITLEKRGNQCILSVQDEGPGIAPELQERIFERFFTVERSRNRKLGGSGLGLSIVRNAITSHGGSVKVKSALGEGATFIVQLPLKLKLKKKSRGTKSKIGREGIQK